jgi:2,3-bisphosphoglycerate-independent phosphoglycerate mutase
MLQALKKTAFPGPKGPVVLAILDGIGLSDYTEGNAVRAGNTPNLNWLMKNALFTSLKAHGTAVGLPSDEDMGNSEVGHNAIGCGRVFDQGAKLVTEALNSGALFRGHAWTEITGNCLNHHSTLHFIGLFSDGNVHSHIDHLKAMLEQAKREGIKKARIHILLDGRDVGETSALEYVDPFEAFLAQLNADGTVDFRIASGGGRMKITMDRYNADWSMVQRGWDTHIRGKGVAYPSAREAIVAIRKDHPGVIDQDLAPFVIARDGKPVGPILDGDSVVFFNFRGDRAIEITRAFDDETLDRLDRSPRPKVEYAGMMQYDGDLKLPKRYLVTPPAIDRTMGEFLARSGVSQYAISETQKFGHVTYFFNGNRSGKFDDRLETYVEITSDIIPYEQRPWMKAAEITDTLLAAIQKGSWRFMRLNYPNGDMVGHTGVFPAVQIAVESVDLCLGRLIKAVEAAQGILVVSADHGNAEDMIERNKKTGKLVVDPETGVLKVKTAHSLNPVPCLVYDTAKSGRINLADRKGLGISSLAATCIRLLGYEPPADYDPSVIDIA